MLDFGELTACIVWFVGCNMRCIYCYNTQIVTSEGKVSTGEFYKFLKSRIGKLDGVVFSGGECTNCKSFMELAKSVKELNFLLKVDTNGSNPQVIKEAIRLNLIDKISLDFKADEENFKFITNSDFYEKFLYNIYRK